ncbi:hypothetical protein [Reichenbachiella sp. MALMAid0571]|uniref:hypothetical protein n=1 Tax=Reichenbachiella sp. MALMAid0571 TaxID=3143939 RepID=UPI0032DF3457
MGGFGALGMMNKSLKDNKALLGKKKSLKELYRELDNVKSSKFYLNEKPSPKELISALRKKMIREYRIRLLKLLALISIIGMTVAVFCVKLIF